MDIPTWIRKSRNQANLTLEQLGEAVGRTKANVSSWENGRHEPSYSQMLRIAQVCKAELPSFALEAQEPSGIYAVAVDAETARIVNALSTLSATERAQVLGFMAGLQSSKSTTGAPSGEFPPATGTNGH